MFNIISRLGNTENNSVHTLGWLKPKTLTTPNAESDMEQEERWLTTGKGKNASVTLEDHLAIF